MKHKSGDYKLGAVRYYVDNDRVSLSVVCEIFKCKKSSL